MNKIKSIIRSLKFLVINLTSEPYHKNILEQRTKELINAHKYYRELLIKKNDEITKLQLELNKQELLRIAKRNIEENFSKFRGG